MKLQPNTKKMLRGMRTLIDLYIAEVKEQSTDWECREWIRPVMRRAYGIKDADGLLAEGVRLENAFISEYTLAYTAWISAWLATAGKTSGSGVQQRVPRTVDAVPAPVQEAPTVEDTPATLLNAPIGFD